MIYFYGGAFNPMTNAHFEIIKNIINKMKDEDSLIIAITDHDYKKYAYDYNTRLDIVLKNIVKIDQLNDVTLGGKYQIIKQNCRTWKFINSLELYDDITIIVGQDEYDDLIKYKWFYSKDLIDLYKFEIIPRTDDISSTKVRELINKSSKFEELKKYISKETFDILNKKV